MRSQHGVIRASLSATAIFALLAPIPGVAAEGFEPPAPETAAALAFCVWQDEQLAAMAPESAGNQFALLSDGKGLAILMDTGEQAKAGAEPCPASLPHVCESDEVPAGLAFTSAGILCVTAPNHAGTRMAPNWCDTLAGLGVDSCPTEECTPLAECLDVPCDVNTRAYSVACIEIPEIGGECDTSSLAERQRADICIPQTDCKPLTACVPDADELCQSLVLTTTRAYYVACVGDVDVLCTSNECVEDLCNGIYLAPDARASIVIPCVGPVDTPCTTDECVEDFCDSIFLPTAQRAQVVCVGDYIPDCSPAAECVPDPCPYMPNQRAQVNLACGLTECDVLYFVPGQCGQPPLEPCDFVNDVPGTCGGPQPDPCDTSIFQSRWAGVQPIPGPCGDIVLPALCELFPTAPLACESLPPLPLCEQGFGHEAIMCVSTDGVPCVASQTTDGTNVCVSVGLVKAIYAYVRDREGIFRAIAKTQDDLDQDGLGDEWEQRVAGDLETLRETILDPDGDDLQNIDEFRWDTNPFDADSDDDHLMDGPEAAYWDRTDDALVSLSEQKVALRDVDSTTDSDADGQPNILDPDSDNDHLLDGHEYLGTHAGGVATFLEHPDSEDAGAGDGLTDYQEALDTDNDPTTGIDDGYNTNPRLVDTDGDGLTDGRERDLWAESWNQTFDCDGSSNNLLDADADGDSVTDGYEADNLMFADTVDTDFDGIDDGYEVTRGFNPVINDATLDPDNDRLTTLIEYQFGMHAEYSVCEAGPYFSGLDPRNGDMDADALVDGEELLGTRNRFNEEYHAGYPRSTAVWASDSDSDGLDDTYELLTASTNPNAQDTDGDGLSDATEHFGTTDPLNPDTDGDGLNDGQEFWIGSDPRNPDSDGDGFRDGDDSNPVREQIPPSYPGGASTYIVFDEAGYIDVLVEDVATDETDIMAVTLSGSLQATSPSGATLPTLRFNTEATRGEDGSVWGARLPIPPGVGNIVQEDLRLLVTDDEGNHWAATGTFHNRLNGPAWSTSPSAKKTTNGWNTLIEHQTIVPNAPTATALSVANPTYGLSVYRLDATAFEPQQVVMTILGEQTILHAADSFQAVSPAQEPQLYQAMAFGVKWRSPKQLYMGMQGKVNAWMDQAYDSTESGFRSAKYQSASFFLGSDHPAAHERDAGDFVGGFLLWGDIRDCLIRPTYVDPNTQLQQIIEAAIVALSCSGIAIDVAQATPGAPAAVAGNAALVSIKLVLKRLVRLDPQLALHFVDLIKVCTKNLALCPAIGGLAKLAKDDNVSRAGMRKLMDGLEAEDAARFATQYPKAAEKASRIGTEYTALARGLDDFATVMRNSHVPLGTWNADQTLNQVINRYELFKKLPNVDPNLAPQFMADISRAVGKAQVGKLPAVDLQNFLSKTLVEGDYYEMRYVTQVLDQGKSVSVFARSYRGVEVDVWKNGNYVGKRTVDGEIDVALGSFPAAIRTEIKKSASLIDLKQIEKQVGHLKTHTNQYANEYHLITGTAPSTSQLSGMSAIAKDYAVIIRVFDQGTGQKWAYGSNGRPIST